MRKRTVLFLVLSVFLITLSASAAWMSYHPRGQAWVRKTDAYFHWKYKKHLMGSHKVPAQTIEFYAISEKPEQRKRFEELANEAARQAEQSLNQGVAFTYYYRTLAMDKAYLLLTNEQKESMRDFEASRYRVMPYDLKTLYNLSDEQIRRYVENERRFESETEALKRQMIPDNVMQRMLDNVRLERDLRDIDNLTLQQRRLINSRRLGADNAKYMAEERILKNNQKIKEFNWKP